MQTLVPSHIQHKGTVGDKVFVDSGTYPYHWRKRPKSAKTSLRALKKESKRAAFINKLAGEINDVMRQHFGGFKGKNFYHRLLKKFRRTTMDNRFLLLREAQEMHIKQEYPDPKPIGNYTYEIHPSANEITVKLTTTAHYTPDYSGTPGCYYFEVLLITWSNKKGVYDSRHACKWIDVPGIKPVLTFTFSLPHPASQFLLCIGHRSGKNHILDLSEDNRSMQIVEAGTFEEADLEALKNCKPWKSKAERVKGHELKEVDVWVKVGKPEVAGNDAVE